MEKSVIWTFLSQSSASWIWLLAGVMLCVLELLLPANVLLWLGLSALATGLLVFVLPMLAWQLQISLFAVLAVISMIAGRHFLKRSESNSEAPLLNRRGQQYQGRTVVLTNAITNGVGRVSVDNTLWRVIGPDADSGTKMKVVGVEGASLRVERLS